MRVNADIVVGCVGLLIGFGALAAMPSQVSGETYAAILNMNSPAFFPLWAGVGMVAVSLALLFTGLAQIGSGGGEPVVIDHARQVLVVAALVVVYAVAIRQLGMVSASILMILALGALLGYRRWPVLGAVALGVPLLIYFLFERTLLILLPRGVLF